MQISTNKAFCLAAMALACATARADWILPSGSSVSLGGGTASMGCVSMQNSGTLAMDASALVAARDVAVAAGAQLQIGSGRVELAQQWINNGTATATSGGVVRMASPGCPLLGSAGPVPLTSAPAPQPVPLPGGGSAQVSIAGMPPGCTLATLSVNSIAPVGAPASATFPLGVLRFTATNCTNAALSVTVTYPPGSLAGLTMQKYGPHGPAGSRQTGWFTPPGLSVSGETVSYTVADNGEGDSDTTLGTIVDPFAPMLLAAPPAPGPTGTQAVPALGEWGLLLLSGLAGLLGLRRLAAAQRTLRRRCVD